MNGWLLGLAIANLVVTVAVAVVVIGVSFSIWDGVQELRRDVAKVKAEIVDEEDEG